jgi:lipoate-protein ligase A
VNPLPDTFRLIQSGFHDAFYNMGFDEALLESVAGGKSPPVLRLYGWKPAAVSVGYFQGLDEEVDIDACRVRGIDVIRRITGGGAVFHQAELTYSILLPETHPLAGRGIRDSYGLLCAGIIRGLSRLGLSPEFVPINDILCQGRKVSGNAQTRRQGMLLQHGTVILNLDAELMFSLLKVPPEKLKGHLVQEVKSRVAGLEDCLGRHVPFEEAETALIEGFREGLSLDLYPDAPSAAEEKRALVLAREKFASPEWLYKR